MRRFLLLLLLAAPAAAQDERSVSSPDGQLEFRLALAQPGNGALFRLAYQIDYRGKRLIDTSFLGFNIRNQEPLLGENVGLTGSRTAHEKGYNALFVAYMQNGSLGRRIDIEVRAADDGIAFRYLIPRSTPLEEILIDDELTEFDLAGAFVPERADLPFAIEHPAAGWLAIAESGNPPYPGVELTRTDGPILVTRLKRTFQGTTPLTCPWRIVIIGRDREHLAQSEIGRHLAQ